MVGMNFDMGVIFVLGIYVEYVVVEMMGVNGMENGGRGNGVDERVGVICCVVGRDWGLFMVVFFWVRLGWEVVLWCSWWWWC